MIHHLKTWPEYFSDIESGEKRFELRKDDRPYTVGDTLVLQEYDATKAKYSGNELTFTVSYILRNASEFGLMPGYCVLGFKD